MDAIDFFVAGNPAPQGSKKAFVRGRRAILVEQSDRVAPWRQDVAAEALRVKWDTLWAAPVVVQVHLEFYFRRPQSHYRTGRNAHMLRDAAPARYHAQKPDIDKLQRSTLDALTTAGLITDDCTVAKVLAEKFWTGRDGTTGARIWICTI